MAGGDRLLKHPGAWLLVSGGRIQRVPGTAHRALPGYVQLPAFLGQIRAVQKGAQPPSWDNRRYLSIQFHPQLVVPFVRRNGTSEGGMYTNTGEPLYPLEECIWTKKLSCMKPQLCFDSLKGRE